MKGTHIAKAKGKSQKSKGKREFGRLRRFF
jgi:hypothetical protein